VIKLRKGTGSYSDNELFSGVKNREEKKGKKFEKTFGSLKTLLIFAPR